MMVFMGWPINGPPLMKMITLSNVVAPKLEQDEVSRKHNISIICFDFSCIIYHLLTIHWLNISLQIVASIMCNF